MLPILASEITDDSLIVQGNEKVAWSALIARKTGLMTLTVADRKGAYIINSRGGRV